jgi:hypothetical protein
VPEQGRIPKDVWRKVRMFKRTIALIADRLDEAATERERIKGLLYDYACKGEVGRARALAKLRKHFNLATITFPRGGLMWSWLAPRGCMLIDPKDEGEAQDAIIVRYGFAWIERRRELNGYEAFSLEVPDHATARLVQRAPNVNLPRPLSTALAEQFPTRMRASGLGIVANVATMAFGGFAPFFVTWLIEAMGSPIAPMAYYVAQTTEIPDAKIHDAIQDMAEQSKAAALDLRQIIAT